MKPEDYSVSKVKLGEGETSRVFRGTYKGEAAIKIISFARASACHVKILTEMAQTEVKIAR